VPIVGAAVHGGDMVIVKGSNAIRMSAIVDALKQRAAKNLPGALTC
jgi:UDP-N-acetylmuramyl pentapeptide synthase